MRSDHRRTGDYRRGRQKVHYYGARERLAETNGSGEGERLIGSSGEQGEITKRGRYPERRNDRIG